MLDFLSAILLATAISLDGLGVGVAYGVKGMKIPRRARLLVAMVSVLTVTAAFFFGSSLRWIFSPQTGILVGRLILVAVGLWLLAQGWLAGGDNDEVDGEDSPLARFSVKSLGIVVLILRHPASADLDRSGSINPAEALLLGLALATDAFGAGTGAAAGRTWPLYTPLLVGLSKFVFLSVGLLLGRAWQKNLLTPWLNYLPGLLLLILAFTGF